MKHDEFGDRMKGYEHIYTSTRIPVDNILVARLDGKGFSKFTKGFKKPFDDRLSEAMILTAESIQKETHANFAYTQSDEITLVYVATEKASEHFLGGKISKINSILASMAAANFNQFIAETAPEVYEKKGLAYFDCRAFAVPTIIEASNTILWRVQDARKNSVSALFRWTAGHRAMDGLDQAQMKIFLLENNGVDWNDLSNRYKYGTYMKIVPEETTLSDEVLMKIPKDKRPDGPVMRSKQKRLDHIGYYGDLSLEERIELLE